MSSAPTFSSRSEQRHWGQKMLLYRFWLMKKAMSKVSWRQCSTTRKHLSPLFVIITVFRTFFGCRYTFWISWNMLRTSAVWERAREALLNTVHYYTTPSYILGFPSASNISSNIPRMTFPETESHMEEPLTGSGRRPMFVRSKRQLRWCFRWSVSFWSLKKALVILVWEIEQRKTRPCWSQSISGSWVGIAAATAFGRCDTDSGDFCRSGAKRRYEHVWVERGKER